jgi:hypothetical protein
LGDYLFAGLLRLVLVAHRKATAVTLPRQFLAMQSQAQRLAPAGILTSLDRRSENVRVSPIVIAELELGT